VEAWSEKDPVARYRTWLSAQGVLDETFDRDVQEEAERTASEMRDKLARAVMPPAGEAVYGHVYQRPSAQFLREREEFEASLDQS
jgi:pyruvate dehydrogenase E1 component alpha subunit